jgi:hypothetical protein
MEYYYNHMPGKNPWRNNLIYTSLISTDKKVFCQWYHTDSEYHKGYNEVIDPTKMKEKWQREVKFLKLMSASYPSLVPTILDIDSKEQKIYLEIDGVDFWQRSLDANCSFDEILPDWQEQMIEIIKAHRSLGLYKYSMHPSSYFVLDNKLKSINYFFTYEQTEPYISISDVESHIYSTRKAEIRTNLKKFNIDWNTPQSFDILNQLCWESFKSNYPLEFITRAKNV